MIPIYPLKKGEGLPEKLRSRSQLTQKDVSAAVAEILAAVRARGDEALYEYEERFDHADLRKAGLAVTREEVEAACETLGVDVTLTDGAKLTIEERGDSGRAKTPMETVALSELANETAMSFEPVAFEAGHPLEYELAENLTVRGSIISSAP